MISQHRVCFLALCLSGLFPLAGVQAQQLEWIRQLGTAGYDEAWGVSTDSLGNVYISGYTYGRLGATYAGGSDAFVTKYDASGSLQWTRQLGTSSGDWSFGVHADTLGNVYVSGNTFGSLGRPNAGNSDAFVSKYDAAGNLQWTRQLGTGVDDWCIGVSADSLGNVYIAGQTRGNLGGTNAGNHDSFLSKYDVSGNLQWTRLLGTADEDFNYGVSADSLGNVYISGYTKGSLGTTAGNEDAYLCKYDALGNLQWIRQLGTAAWDGSYAVSADTFGNVFVSGGTSGNLGGPNAGNGDAFVSKFDAAGSLQWIRQLGTHVHDHSLGVGADILGNVYISGLTSGSLGGPNAGNGDAFVSKYDASGNLLWTGQLGTARFDESYGVSADSLGNVYISGRTLGSLGGPNAAPFEFDAFVAKYSTIPEPGALLLGTVAGVVLLLPRARRA